MIKTFPKLNYYDKFYNIYDRDVQDKLIKELNEYIADPNSMKLHDTFEDIVSLHRQRRAIQIGMRNRSRLEPASIFEVPDPKEADGVPIFARPKIGETKENHKLHTAFDKKIVTNKSSYIAGKAPALEASDAITDYYDNSDFNSTLMELLQSATRGGNGYVLAVSPEGENEAYLTQVSEWQCISLYDIYTGELEYSIRYYPDVDIDNMTSSKWTFELYTKTEKHSYSYDGGWSYKGSIVHLFEGVPLVEFANNSERTGDVELTISLQDAYDILQSDLSSEVTQLRLAYLSMKSDDIDIDEEWLKKLKQTGIFIGDGQFIEKNLNSETVEALKTDLERQIYEYSHSYDPNSLGASGDITAYQIRQKLFGLEQAAAETIKMFTRSIKYVFTLIAKYYKTYKQTEMDDFDIKFRVNVPSNIIEDMLKAVQAGYKISQKQMSMLVPFEIDQEMNEEQLAEEREAGTEMDPFATVEEITE